MNGYLLDTNIISDLVRNPAGRVARKIANVGEDAVATSVIVAAELRFGAARKGSPALSARIDAILGALPVLLLEPRRMPHMAIAREARTKRNADWRQRYADRRA